MAVFMHQAFQRAKPHDYHKPFEETEAEYQRVMKSIAGEIIQTLHHQLQKALTCGKELPDGSICGCKLDCHLHDWRQRDEVQKARHDWLREEIVKLKDRQRGWLGKEEDGSDRHPNHDELQTIIDRYQAELDQAELEGGLVDKE